MYWVYNTTQVDTTIHSIDHHLLPASLPFALPPPAFILAKQPKCITSLFGNTATTLPPSLLWQAPHTLSSWTTTLRFLPPLPPGTLSPKRRPACVLTTSVFRKPVTTRDSLTMEFAARMRPRKYDSSTATGRVAGMILSVDEAGRREPCFERSESAGGQFGSCPCGGVRYSDSRV